MVKWNLQYRRRKIESNNFKPIINYNLYPDEEIQEYNPPIEEFVEQEEDLVIIDEEEVVEEEPQTALLLEKLVKELKKIRSVRRLELWISQNKKRVMELNQIDMEEFLKYVNEKYYSKKKK